MNTNHLYHEITLIIIKKHHQLVNRRGVYGNFFQCHPTSLIYSYKVLIKLWKKNVKTSLIFMDTIIWHNNPIFTRVYSVKWYSGCTFEDLVNPNEYHVTGNLQKTEAGLCVG